MAWTDGVTRAVGYLITAANWNDLLGAAGSLMQLKSHTHGGTTGEGSQSLGPLVLEDFTDAAAPAAPGAGKTRVYAVSGKPRTRAGAAGADDEMIVGSKFTAKGDLLTATGASNTARKAVGADGTFLKANSAQADGLEWITVSNVTITKAETSVAFTTSSTTYVLITGMSIAVTVASASNKVEYMLVGAFANGAGNAVYARIQNTTDATQLVEIVGGMDNTNERAVAYAIVTQAAAAKTIEAQLKKPGAPGMQLERVRGPHDAIR